MLPTPPTVIDVYVTVDSAASIVNNLLTYFGLEKLQACFGHGGNGKAPDATGQPRWRRPVKNSALGFYGVLLLMLSGDVSLNPGPRSCKFPCGTCGKPVRGNHAGIQCDSCDRWLHCKCITMSVREYKLLFSDHSELWFCTTCVLPQFTDSFFNTSSDSAGDLTNEPEGIETLDSPNKITRKGSAGDLTNAPEGTETLDSPNKITRKGLILAHLNINSLLAHLDELKAYLLYQRLDILSLTETKLDSKVTNDELTTWSHLPTEQRISPIVSSAILTSTSTVTRVSV